MMSDPTVPTVFIVLVIVRRDDRYVLVEETRDRGWYLPGGRLEPGEDLLAGARREVLEEAGIGVEIEGVLRFEHTPAIRGVTRLRCILIGRPTNDAPLKGRGDRESCGAAWFRVDEIASLRLRAGEVETLVRYVQEGGSVSPLSILAREGAPLPPDS